MNTEQSESTSWRELLKLVVLVFAGVGVILVVISSLKKDLDSRRANEKVATSIQKATVPPAEIKQALENLKENVGTIEEQRQDIEKINKALNNNTVTSKSLGMKVGSSWLTPFRMKVDVREAVIAWKEIVKIYVEISGPYWYFSNAERKKGALIERAEKLYKIVLPQVESTFAKSEGLNITRCELFRVIARIRNGGKNPE
jgi:hypothetical protein